MESVICVISEQFDLVEVPATRIYAIWDIVGTDVELAAADDDDILVTFADGSSGWWTWDGKEWKSEWATSKGMAE